ncbi:MAG: RNA polymerase sigma-54 factor [Anaerolineae bacterium]|nr:RNA polymerase sigma-54 factor [Anaerolineae bacterium]
MQFDMEMAQTQEMRPSPMLVMRMNMLLLSSLELQQVIEQELEENPALEADEVDVCPLCSRPWADCRCWSSINTPDVSAGQTNGEDDELDMWAMLPRPISLSEYLYRELSPQIDREDNFIAEYLIGSLDEHGFLGVTVEDLARGVRVEVERVAAVLKQLQMVGPVGIGARDARECLLLQLRRWEERGQAHGLARPLVEEYFEALGEGRYGYIARCLKVSTEDILAGRDFIRNHLRPYPVPDLSELGASGAAADTPYVAPDVIIRERVGAPSEFDVEVVESRHFVLKVAPYYQELAHTLAAVSHPSVTREDQEVVKGYVTRARMFIRHLRERRETLRCVAEYVVEQQKDYLCHGSRHLKPLTRAEVAAALGFHESTISRATANKFVLLPSYHVVPFSQFFQASLPVQEALKEIIASEPNPMTDAQLVEALGRRGYQLARRTVAKYRAQLGILPSVMR